jgi:putative ABC transport system ATP-binding protein
MAPVVVENASKNFPQGDRLVSALNGVSLDVQRGQFLAIMGASGSGKSTLLHLIAALAKPDGGRVLIDGQDVGLMNDRTLTRFRRRNIGLIFQAFNLIPTLSAEENVALPLMLDGRLGKDEMAKVEELLRSLGLIDRRLHRPDAMSGGEQQRVAIGRAVCELLRDLSVIHGKTVVMVTHEPTVAAYASEVAVLKDGKLVERFPTESTNGSQGLAARYQESLR